MEVDSTIHCSSNSPACCVLESCSTNSLSYQQLIASRIVSKFKRPLPEFNRVGNTSTP